MKILKAKNGIKYYCYDKFDYIPLCIKKSGDYETEIKEIAKIYLSNKQGTVVDIGSNIGTFCIPLAKVFSHHSFQSFEILNHVYKIHSRNNKLNKIKNIKLNNLGISNSEYSYLEKVPNYKICKNIGGFSIDKQIQKLQKYKYISKNFERLYLNKLDNLKIKNVVLIKVDTEGHELEVFKGAEYTIKKFKPMIIFETNNKSYYLKKNLRCRQYLLKLGYKIKSLKDNSVAYHEKNDPLIDIIQKYINVINNYNFLKEKNNSIKSHILQILLLFIKRIENKFKKFLLSSN
jgi:FkbM family methyltransferase